MAVGWSYPEGDQGQPQKTGVRKEVEPWGGILDHLVVS